MEILGGPLYTVAGAGESHGPGITTIISGCPPGLLIERSRIQSYLNRRRPGGNRHGTPRQEKDRVLFLAGLFDDQNIERLTSGPELSFGEEGSQEGTRTYESGFTTGEPIAALVLSTSQRSGHYDQFSGPEGEVRPGHTDLVKYHQSRGFVDVRGGGRSSYRSTISDVIGGSIARLFLQEHFGTVILSSISRVGSLQSPTSLAATVATMEKDSESGSISQEALSDLEERLSRAEIPTLDRDFAEEAAALIKATRIAGDSLGAQVEVIAVNPPSLVGEPLYQSLKIRIMGALGGLNAAQSCEIGDGIDVVGRRGSENNDPIRQDGYQRNSHGGLIGGITTGSPIVCRVGFKPTSTITHPQESVRKNLDEIEFQLKKGRHDPCVGVRAGITLESRLAIELMNGTLMHQTRHVDPDNFRLFP